MIPERMLAVDASVAVKWYVPEAGHTAASAILERGDLLVAPDLLAAEFGNVIWKKVRRGELLQSEAEAVLDAFISSSPVALRPVAAFLRPAFEIASACGCTVYDALYVAVALAEGCPLVTADSRLAEVLGGTRLQLQVQVLSDL